MSSSNPEEYTVLLKTEAGIIRLYIQFTVNVNWELDTKSKCDKSIFFILMTKKFQRNWSTDHTCKNIVLDVFVTLN